MFGAVSVFRSRKIKAQNGWSVIGWISSCSAEKLRHFLVRYRLRSNFDTMYTYSPCQHDTFVIFMLQKCNSSKSV